MKKQISFLILSTFLFISICPAFPWFKKKQEPVLIMSGTNLETVLDVEKETHRANVFGVNQKIFFNIHVPDGFKSDYVKYQVIRQTDEAHLGGFSKIMTVTKRLNNKNDFGDYFIIRRTGKYFLQVFDIVDLNKWLSIVEFRVVD